MRPRAIFGYVALAQRRTYLASRTPKYPRPCPSPRGSPRNTKMDYLLGHGDAFQGMGIPASPGLTGAGDYLACDSRREANLLAVAVSASRSGFAVRQLDDAGPHIPENQRGTHWHNSLAPLADTHGQPIGGGINSSAYGPVAGSVAVVNAGRRRGHWMGFRWHDALRSLTA
jgi:hypothetical protein